MTTKKPKKTTKKIEATHFNQTPRRKAEFIKPLHTLRSKVGYGGLSEDILNKAQTLLEDTAVDFQPLADMYLGAMLRAIELAKNAPPGADGEVLIAGILYPAVQLKASGGMFKYGLITRVGDKLIQFLEVIAEPDPDAIEIALAFHTTLRAIVLGHVTGDGGKHGKELMKALEDACMRYFEHYPDKIIRP